MIMLDQDCEPIGEGAPEDPLRLFCPPGEYSAVGNFWFQQPESSLRSLLHEPKGTFEIRYSDPLIGQSYN